MFHYLLPQKTLVANINMLTNEIPSLQCCLKGTAFKMCLAQRILCRRFSSNVFPTPVAPRSRQMSLLLISLFQQEHSEDSRGMLAFALVESLSTMVTDT